MKNTLSVVGIMNGTSIDGVDFALCQITRKPEKCVLKAHVHVAFPEDLKQDLTAAAKHEMKVGDLAEIHHELGRFYADAILKIKTSKKWQIDLVGVHGQTVYHAGARATLQIGETAYLKAALGVPIVSDFRPLDIAYKGQGAPIATLFHKQILAPLATDYWYKHAKTSGTGTSKKAKSGQSKPTSPSVAIQNLGGIANVSFFTQAQKLSKTKNKKNNAILSFDTGPANMLMDLAIRHITRGQSGYDNNGELASKGIPIPSMLNRWLAHAFLAQKPPKSCGREEFGENFFQRALNDFESHKSFNAETFPADFLASLTEFTALSIALSYRNFLPQIPSIIALCGGGAHNTYFRSRIQFHLPEALVCTATDLGWPSETIEAAAFALLAAYRVWDLPSNLPETTGATKAVSLGKIQ